MDIFEFGKSMGIYYLKVEGVRTLRICEPHNREPHNTGLC